MKRSLIALVVMGAVSTVASSQTSLTVFGVMDIGIRQVKNGSAGSILSQANGSNNTSRLGFRGVVDLGGGLSAQFWLESTILADSGVYGSSTQAFDRRSTLGLASATFGELRVGRDYRPTHILWSAFDPYTTVGVGSANQFNSATAAVSGSGADVTRANNAVEYILPGNLGGVTGAFFLSPDEGTTVALGGAKSRGGRIGYAGGPFSVSAALVTIKNTPAYEFKDSVIGGSYNFGVATVALARRTFTWGPDKQGLTLLALTAPLGAGTLKASYIRGNQSGATAAANGRDASQLAVGYVHNLSKRTALYGTVSRMSNKNAARFVLPGGPAGILGGETSTGVDLGIRHSF